MASKMDFWIARPGYAAFALAAGYFGEVNVDLVHTAVFHDRGDLGDDGLEAPRKRRYSSKSTGSRMACGQSLAAFMRPMADPTPNWRAA